VKSHLTKDFRIYFANLPERIRRLAKENYRLWRENPYHPSLAFKRIGKRYPAYSVRVGLGWRAVGFRDGNTMVWFWIGSHPEYERLIQQL
jgi:hypothetical protein